MDRVLRIIARYILKWWPRMAGMEHGMVTERATVLFLVICRFMSLPNNRLGGPGDAKGCGFCR